MTTGEQLTEALCLLYRVWKADVDGTDISILDDIDSFLERYPIEDIPHPALVKYVTTPYGCWLVDAR